MGADADAGPAQVEFTHVDGVEGVVPGILAHGKNVRLGNGVIVEGILGHIALHVDDVFDQLEVGFLGADGEENIVPRVRHLAKGGDNGGFVGIADVVFAPVGQIAATRLRGQHHVAGVDVGPMLLLRQTKGEDLPGFQKGGGLRLHLLVVPHPQRPQPQHGNLPRIPVVQTIEAQDLIKGTITPRIPAGGTPSIARRGHERGKGLMRFHKIQKIRIPDPLVIVVLERCLALALEKADGLQHELAGVGVQGFPGVGFGIYKNHRLLLWDGVGVTKNQL